MKAMKPRQLCTVLGSLALCIAQVAAEATKVTCGSTIKLRHERTRYYLHSHEVHYGTGSGQQSVTGYSGDDDSNDYWTIKGPVHSLCWQGAPVAKGAEIRLQHVRTRRWLHSHLHRSPLSGNQEVSCFGSDLESDDGDVWIVTWDGKEAAWAQDTPVRLQHKATKTYLFSHNMQFGRPEGQMEVATSSRKDANARWLAAEGVYFDFVDRSAPPRHDEL